MLEKGNAKQRVYNFRYMRLGKKFLSELKEIGTFLQQTPKFVVYPKGKRTLVIENNYGMKTEVFVGEFIVRVGKNQFDIYSKDEFEAKFSLVAGVVKDGKK